MVHAARASTASAPAPLSTRHFLIGHAAIKNARNSPENNVLHFSNRLKTAICSARFSRVLRRGLYPPICRLAFPGLRGLGAAPVEPAPSVLRMDYGRRRREI